MSKKSIWVHTLVKNEERYLWYAVMSVVDFVDKVLLWDTGSSDKTLEIIKQIQSIKGNKVEFKEVGEVDPEEFTQIRQQMLEQTKSDWFMIVDGDEIWWEKSIKQVVKTIQKEGDNLESIVFPYFNIVGDIYHYQEEKAGRYQIDDRLGHINIRAMKRNIPGLHFAKPHGQQGLYDQDNTLIQERDSGHRKFNPASYMHFTNMIRSSSQADAKVPKRSFKFKYEIGLSFPKDFQFPEVFYQQRPEIVPSPWDKMSIEYFLRSSGETLLRKAKRKLISPKGFGY